jgi:hypothetical protein
MSFLNAEKVERALRRIVTGEYRLGSDEVNVNILPGMAVC